MRACATVGVGVLGRYGRQSDVTRSRRVRLADTDRLSGQDAERFVEEETPAGFLATAAAPPLP